MLVQDIWNHYFAGDHDTVVSTTPYAVEVLHIGALSHIALGNFDEAALMMTAALTLNPNSMWYANACIAYFESSDPLRGLSYAYGAVELFPDNYDAQFNAANLMTACRKHEIASLYLSNAINLRPDSWEANMNFGNNLRRLGRFEDAIKFYDTAAELNKDDVAGQIRTKLNKAVTLCDIGHEIIALKIFEELEGKVDSPEMDFNRACLKIKFGDFEEGWKLYQKRWECGMAREDIKQFQKPMLTDLKNAAGKRVLFCHEQGFGDSIQFVRYAPMFAKHGIDVTICVPVPLVRLFSSFGLPVVTSRDEAEYDFECPMLNAPMLFDTTLDTIPAEPYLSAPEALVEARRPIDAGKLKIGLVWAGQARDSAEMKMIDQRRSIFWKNFSTLLDEDATFYSLQFGDRGDDVGDEPIIKTLDPSFDFLDTASVIMNLDLVICVDTSVAHLAAALGKPTWILSRLDGCWRWMKDRFDSPWYPSVRIFQQKKAGDWAPVLDEVREALRNLI